MGEHATNRPDLVSRVFHLKLRELLRDLLEENVLGVVVAYTWTVEFQKRGPPHAHILLVVRPEDKPRAPELVDKVVSAELPDKTDPLQARLYAIVSACLLHGPCGAFAPNMPCMDSSGKCCKGLPCDFEEHTRLPPDRYAAYRRRDNERTVEKKGCTLDNRWVIPYNPYLTKKYEAHINVHVCTSIRAVKYLYK